MKLRVLHISQSDSHGGAAIAARRLVEAQRACGIDAQMLVLHKATDAPWIHQFGSPLLRSRIRITRMISKNFCKLFSGRDGNAMKTLGLFRTGLAKAGERLRPDVIHWHWVGAECVSISELSEPKTPAVWTCHDHWVMGGADHSGVALYKEFKHSGTGYDFIEDFCFRRKNSVWLNWNPCLIFPSYKIINDIPEESICYKFKRKVIYNTLDFETFTPMDKERSRLHFGISGAYNIVLFGSQSGMKDTRKGFDLLIKALKDLPDKYRQKVLIVTFGGASGESVVSGFRCLSVGRIDNPKYLAKLYSCADVFVNSSRVETFGNTTLEAVACGVPVVSFDVGASSEIILSRDNGQVVLTGDTMEMSRAIAYYLGHPQRLPDRSRLIDKFGKDRIVQEHLDVYSQQIDGR